MTPTPAQTRANDNIRVEALLNDMTLAEKIGQMTQVDKRAIDPADVTEWHLGSVLSGGGANPNPNTPHGWAEMVARIFST